MKLLVADLREEVRLEKENRERRNIKIDDLCSDSNLVELPLNAKDNHKRNSQKLIYKWHDILTNDEIKRIRNEVLSISEIWYSNSDWLPPQAGDSI